MDLNFHDETHDGLEKVSARTPGESVVPDLLLDEGKIHSLVELKGELASSKIVETIANLGQNAQNPDVAGGGQLEVVDEAEPESLLQVAISF